MSDQDLTRSEDSRLISLLSGATGSVSGALIGLSIGGPVGAIAGAATGPFVAFSIELLSSRENRARKLLSEAAKISGDHIDEFSENVLETEEKADLALRILEIGSRTFADEKSRALSALLAKIRFTETGSLEDDRVILNILSSLEQSHLSILSAIGVYCREHQDAMGCPPSVLIRDFPNYDLTIRSIVRTLELHGLIVDEARLGPTGHTGEVFWKPSAFGHSLLYYLSSNT